jgi:16S rRNA (cytidine1402-2'-O)-methyltransferase
MAGTLFVVATPIGNLEDITVRALRVHAIATPTTSLHEHNEAAKSASLVARLQRGDSIALVSDAGTPTISDPGGRLIREAIDAGVRVEPIPGPSAVLAALAASGLPTDSFTFFGFPPTRAKDRTEWFERARRAAGTIVFFEAPHRIRQSLGELHREVGDCEVVIGRELTKMHEELVRGPISAVCRQAFEERGEFTIVAFIGLSPDKAQRHEPTDIEISLEFGVMTADGAGTKRQVIGKLAKRHGLTPNRVYEALEAAKKSVK